MSPSGKKKVKTRDIEDVPTTKIGAQGDEPTGHSSKTMPSPVVTKKKTKPKYEGRKTDLEIIAKGGKKKKTKGPAKMDSTYGPDSGDQSLKEIVKEGIQEAGRESQPGAVEYESGLPEEPDTQTRGLSNLPHIRKRQLAERERKEKSKTSSIASNVIQGQRKQTHPLLRAQERRKQLEQPSDFYPDLVSADKVAGRGEPKTAREKQVERVKMMLTRGELDPNSPEVRRILGDDLPEHLKNKRTSDYSSRHRRRSPREEYVEKIKMMLTRGELDPNSPEVRRILGPENLPEHLKVPKTGREKYVEKVEQMIADGELDANSPEVQRILGSGYDPEAELIASEYEEKGWKEGETLEGLQGQGEEEGLIDISKEKVEQEVEQTDAKKATGEVSEEPLKFDKNGYPIYHKDSQKAKEWNEAYANAKPGKFMWDGREYTKGGEKPEDKKEDEKAAVGEAVRQDYATGDANIAESLYTPEQKIENKIEKIQRIHDHHPEWSEKKKEEEIEKEIEDLTKEETAEIREADPNFYVDPWTGFAIDLNQLKKRRDRKDAMEMAALLPANQRAMYLMQEDLISKKDLKKLLKPSEMELLDMQVKQMSLNVQSNNLKLSQQKLRDYRTPEELLELQQSGKIADEERAEEALIRSEKRKIKAGEFDQHIKLYNNAVSNEDYEGQIFFGTLMGFPKARMQKIATARMNLQLATAKKDGTDKEFKKLFQHELSKVYTDRKSFVFGASSVFEEGMMNVEFNGKTYKGRKGLLDAMGLDDWEDLIPEEGGTVQDLDKARKAIHNMTAGREIFQHPEFQNEDGSPNYDALIDDPKTYKRFLMDNIIYQGMYNIYGGSYNNILKYEQKLQARQRQALEPLNEIVTQRQG